MYISKRKKRLASVIVIVGLILIVINMGLFAQQNELSSSSENYLDNIRKLYEKVLEDDRTNYDALTNLGVIYQQTGNEEKSLSFFKKVVRFHPKKARAFHNLGILYSLMNRIDDAVINLNKAAELDSTNPNSVRQLGIIYLQNEMFSHAIETFQQALSRDYYDTESRLGKVLAYWSLKDYDKVLAEINEMQSLGMRFNRMELLLADVYFKKKDYEKAIKYAKIDETENSAQAEGHYLLGVLYEIKGEKDKAEFEFKEVFTIAQQNPKVRLEFSLNIFLNAEIK
jgi:superkiller protein 3